MKTPKNWDLRHKITQFKRFQAEYTENSGHSMRVFQKIGKFAIFSRQLTSNLTNWVENSEKSDFSAIIAEYTENSLNLVSYTIDIIQFKNCEKFSPIVNQNWHFLKCHSYCYTNSVNCSYPKASKAAINCSYIYCEEGHDKVLQTHAFLSNTHTYAHWCYNPNWEHSTK